jgi:hypothetical protein
MGVYSTHIAAWVNLNQTFSTSFISWITASTLLAVFVNGEKEVKLLQKTFISKQFLAIFVNKMLKTEHTSKWNVDASHPWPGHYFWRRYIIVHFYQQLLVNTYQPTIPVIHARHNHNSKPKKSVQGVSSMTIPLWFRQGVFVFEETKKFCSSKIIL